MSIFFVKMQTGLLFLLIVMGSFSVRKFVLTWGRKREFTRRIILFCFLYWKTVNKD